MSLQPDVEGWAFHLYYNQLQNGWDAVELYTDLEIAEQERQINQ